MSDAIDASGSLGGKPPVDLSTPEGIDALLALCDAATPPPWDFRVGGKFSYESVDGVKAENVPPHIVAMYRDKRGRKCTAFVLVCSSTTLNNAANAEFCYAARTALPLALKELKDAKFQRDNWCRFAERVQQERDDFARRCMAEARKHQGSYVHVDDILAAVKDELARERGLRS